MGVPACIYTHRVLAGAYQGGERASIPLELKLDVVEILWKSRHCS